MEIGVNDMDEYFIGEDGFRRCKICGERLEREVEFPISCNSLMNDVIITDFFLFISSFAIAAAV